MNRNYPKDMTTLEIVELYAEERGFICDEDELTAKFDEEVAPLVLAAGISEDDSIAFSEEFNNWKDRLCEDGDIHPEQNSQYGYTGDYA